MFWGIVKQLRSEMCLNKYNLLTSLRKKTFRESLRGSRPNVAACKEKAAGLHQML